MTIAIDLDAAERDYVEGCGRRCPVCGSDMAVNAAVTDLQMTDYDVYERHVLCRECGTEWFDAFRLESCAIDRLGDGYIVDDEVIL